MRKLLGSLAVVALAMLIPALPAPVGPGEAFAVDDPALVDGGCFVVFGDGGTTVTIDTGISGSWNMAVTCEGQAARYKMCEASTTTATPSCAANSVNQLLAQDVTYDIPVPSNRRWLSFTSSDAGTTLRCCVQRVTP